MAKRLFPLFTIIVLLLPIAGVYAQESGEDLYSDIGEVEIEADAGLTPDHPLYVLDDLVEGILIGNNPGRALDYKEEKIAEAELMIEEGKVEEAEAALEKVGEYGEILEREVSPELEKRARESGKAVKELFEDLEGNLEGEEWSDVKESLNEHGEREDRIARAAKISSQIKELCEELSELDPAEYARVCKTDDDDPNWLKRLDKDLTKEQIEEAETFFEIMSECFETSGSECRCRDISVPAFAEKCSIIAPLAAACDLEGDESACDEMDRIEAEDPIEDLLPPHLQEVLFRLEDRYDDAKYDHHMPSECREAGVTDREGCMRIMFEVHAPEECQQALAEGRIDPSNEREAREACEKIMFEAEAPTECIEAGLKDFRECELLMFKLDAPQECLDAGLTGESRNDWRECEVIRFQYEAPQECLDAGITGENRDDWKKCNAITFKLDAPQECLDAGLDGTGRDDWRKCDAIRFELEAPKECLDAGLDGSGRNDWRECEEIMKDYDGYHGGDYEESECKDGCDDECPGASRTSCDSRGMCECYYDEDDGGHGDQDCATIYCQEGTYCENGRCIPFDDGGYEVSECKDGCDDECPGASRTDCVDGGMRCECFYEEHDDGGSQDNSGSDSGSEESETDSGSSDGSGSEDSGGSESDNSGEETTP